MKEADASLLAEVMEFCGVSEADNTLIPLIHAAASVLDDAVGIGYSADEPRYRHLLKVTVNDLYNNRELTINGTKASNAYTNMINNMLLQLKINNMKGNT